ncbi:basic blue protein-like [Hordeum vulgare subsp. vulgare]|uniref:Phytocyanin domain-containing protein n=1 Tax=Hordeum vulgare subsp. vulgare TaxID=112509 RepID=A0A8I6YI13_HORVV|nr:basic blue protein-like [Hordeum vulgare subsp. vulgare]
MPPSHWCRRLLAVALVSMLLVLWRPTEAAEYPVGDGINGWDTGTNYASWAQNRAFATGDVLVFEYVKSQHNVYEVTEAAYRTCDASAAGAVLATYDTGFDKVPLPEARSYWFICEIPGHCMGGMKLAVNVPAGPPGGGAPAPDAPPSPSAGAACRSSWVSWAAGLVVLGAVHVLVN